MRVPCCIFLYIFFSLFLLFIISLSVSTSESYRFVSHRKRLKCQEENVWNVNVGKDIFLLDLLNLVSQVQRPNFKCGKFNIAQCEFAKHFLRIFFLENVILSNLLIIYTYKHTLGVRHRHLRNIDCLMARTACLVCFISTVVENIYRM